MGGGGCGGGGGVVGWGGGNGGVGWGMGWCCKLWCSFETFQTKFSPKYGKKLKIFGSFFWQNDTKLHGEMHQTVGEMKQFIGEMQQTVGERQHFFG